MDPSQPGGDGIEGETPALATAYQRWEGVDAALNDLRNKAQVLMEKHTRQANAAGTRVEAAEPNAFEPATHPGVLQNLINGAVTPLMGAAKSDGDGVSGRPDAAPRDHDERDQRHER